MVVLADVEGIVHDEEQQVCLDVYEFFSGKGKVYLFEGIDGRHPNLLLFKVRTLLKCHTLLHAQ